MVELQREVGGVHVSMQENLKSHTSELEVGGLEELVFWKKMGGFEGKEVGIWERCRE